MKDWNDPALRDFECPKHGFTEFGARTPPDDCEECQNILEYGHPNGRLTLPDHPYVKAIQNYRDWYRDADTDSPTHDHIVEVSNAILNIIRDVELGHRNPNED